MITAEINGTVTNSEASFSFKGLSTDDKPTDKVNNLTIKNGSSFFEIDTQNVKFFDGDSKTWV